MSASIPAGPAWPFLTWSALLVTRLLVWLAELDKRDGRFLSTLTTNSATSGWRRIQDQTGKSK